MPVRADAHPIGWMHGLSLGAEPGWDGHVWLDQEISVANIWALSANFRRPSTGKTLTYEADFEQTTYVANVGLQIFEKIAVAFEVPAASRGGDLLDKIVDDFHHAFNFYRFQRDWYDRGRSKFKIQTDGISTLPDTSSSGQGNYKAQLLLWPVRPKNNCRCGVGLNFDVKFPAGDPDHGLTSGGVDYTVTPSVGFPIGKDSSFKVSASLTYAEKNKVFEDWPRYKWLFGGEMGFDFGIGDTWGMFFLASIQSPFMDQSDLELTRTYVDQDYQNQFQVSSAWNSLTGWRGRESLGPRFRGKHFQLALLMTEDWGFGARDPDGSITYVDNQPDVSFGLHFKMNF